MGGGPELFEIDGGEEVRVDARDMVALDEIVRVNLPIGVKHHPLNMHCRVSLDRLIVQLGDQIAKLRLERGRTGQSRRR